MHTQRMRSIASLGLLLTSMSGTRYAAGTHPTLSRQGPSDGCALLTAGDASTALEATSLPGKHLLESDSKLCGWSHDPKLSDSSSRVVLVIVRPAQFTIAKNSGFTKAEPVSGVGDEAFYQIYPNNPSPFIWVRKGSGALSIRILTRLKPSPPFTIDQSKSKLLVLAKAAVAKL
jgi:RNA polymerase subunit RPABC4/transcription elongation factor Spt4